MLISWLSSLLFKYYNEGGEEGRLSSNCNFPSPTQFLYLQSSALEPTRSFCLPFLHDYHSATWQERERSRNVKTLPNTVHVFIFIELLISFFHKYSLIIFQLAIIVPLINFTGYEFWLFLTIVMVQPPSPIIKK